VRIGIANEPPFGYLEADGTVAGEAPSVARAVFRDLGVDTVTPVMVEFGSLIPGLKAGRFDVIAAGMYITPARCREVLFSDPSYRIAEAMLVPAGNPLAVHSYEDVRDTDDATLGVVAGAVEAGYARDVGIPENRVVTLPDNATAMAAVRSGRISAYAGTALTIRRLAESSDDVEAARPFRGPLIDGTEIAGYGAFGFRKEDRDLRDRFNRRLLEYLGTDAWRETVAPFGFGDHTLPDRTAEELCAGTADAP
jgi:polar amino acid transport system substrate-binding protein